MEPTPADGTDMDDAAMARSTLAMTALTAVSRLTGFARVIVVAAVLGTTFLGNTYQSANTIPNLFFELFAAGALQAVLIPALVEAVDHGRGEDADRVAGTVLGLVAAVLGALSLAGMIAAPLIMRGLVSGVADHAVRDAEVRLGVFLLWFFMPQTVVYALGLVASAALNARNRFLLPVAAPIVNNVVVITSYAVFAWLRHGASPSLQLTLAQKLVLALGTTGAVIAFCAVPVIGARRAGFSLRPRWHVRDPAVRRLLGQGAWAIAYLAVSQVLLAVVLVLANRIAGGVVAYQVAFTVFLLPHALFAVPALTALYPRLSRQALAGEWSGFAESVRRGLDAIAFFGFTATAALLALATPLSRLILFGSSRGSTVEVAGALRGFAAGIAGYGAFLFLTRAMYALRDARTPAIANAATVTVGAVAMVVGFSIASHPDVALLAAVSSAVYVAGALALVGVLARRRRAQLVRLGSDVARHAAVAAIAGMAMLGVAAVINPPGRAGALVTVVVGAATGGAAVLAARAVIREPGARLLPDLLTPGRD